MTVPCPKDLKNSLPVPGHCLLALDRYRQELKEIITGADPRIAIVLGPCSLHDTDSALEYGTRVRALQKQVSRSCFLVMRAHIEKPRSYLGWKGLLHDPFLSGSEDIAEGLFLSRKILSDLVKLEIPLATEFLDPLASCYFSDLICWGFIGARTSSSQIHRQFASSLPMPVGFKNSTQGHTEDAILGALSAGHSHHLLSITDDGLIHSFQSSGNSHSHIALRGTHTHPNYCETEVLETIRICNVYGLSHRILIDCAHGNSRKEYLLQKEVFVSVLQQILSGRSEILGMMLESHLEAGNQSPFCPYVKSSVSVTDPCIDWSMTEELVLLADSLLSSSVMSSVQS